MFHAITKELFYTLTAALVVFCALELVWPGIVLAYININWVLIFWLIVGIVVIALNSIQIYHRRSGVPSTKKIKKWRDE